MSELQIIQDLGWVMLIAAAAAWACHKARLPAIAGCLFAGFLVGPNTPVIALIDDPARAGALLHVGIVFLAFNVGQRIHWQRLRKLQPSLALAACLIAVAVLAVSRSLGTVIGLTGAESLVLGSILVATSATVQERALRKANMRHQSFSHVAMSANGVETVLAVILLVALIAISQLGQAPAAGVVSAVARSVAILVTVSIGTLLLVSQVVPRMAGRVPAELRTLLVVGLLFAMVIMPGALGFPSVLGAVTLGAIVGTLRRNDMADRIMAGTTQAFTPVAFVAMGMLASTAHLEQIWPVMVAGCVIALAVRPVMSAAAFAAVGEPLRDSIRAGFTLTAFGGSSLLVAATAIEGQLVPAWFHTLAASVCFITSIASPLFIRQSEVLADRLESKQPLFVRQWTAFYHERIASLKRRQRSSRLLKFAAPRLVQVSLFVLFSSGLLLFAGPLYRLTEKWVGTDLPFRNGLPLLFWLGFGALLLPTLIALWRNVAALAMMFADAASSGRQRRAFKPLIEQVIKGTAAAAGILWLAALFPTGQFAWWGLLVLGVGFALLCAVFWRHWIRWHSRLEIALKSQVADSQAPATKAAFTPISKTNGHWNLSLAEVEVRDGTQAARRQLAELPLRQEFACTIVSIERQGVLIPNPSAGTVLFPNDKLLLLGRNENLHKAERWLISDVADPAAADTDLADLGLKPVPVPSSSPHAGKPLSRLALGSLFGVQVVGINRGTRQVVSPSGDETIHSGDELLVLGTREQVDEMASWLSS